MGLTGVIYAAIVVAWAIFLVPLALRRHDQTARNRSIERFSSSMRVLSTGGRRRASSQVVVTPPRQEDRVLRPSGSIPEVAHGASVAVGPVSRAALRAAAARRRRVLRVLVAITLVTGAVSVLGVIPRWSFAVPLLLIVAFLFVARRQVRNANESYWRRAANARAESSNVVRRSAVRVEASHGAARGGSGRDVPADAGGGDAAGDSEGDPTDDEPTITLAAQQVAAAAAHDLSESRVVAVALETSDGSSLWDPLPITLPSYVEKPVAKRTVRKITIGESGTWSSGHTGASAVTHGSTAVDQTAHAADRPGSPSGRDGGVEEFDSADVTERPRAANA